MKQNSSPDVAVRNWQQATCNTDSRSSGNGLLCIAYGNLEKAARDHWHSDQPFISDQDLEILLRCCKSKANPTDIQPALASFIEEHLQEDWNEYDDMTHAQRQEIAINLVNVFAHKVLNDTHTSGPASQLLFLLCPQLPVFPVTQEGKLAESTYQGYYLEQKQRFTLALPSLDQGTPDIHYGDSQEQGIIRQILAANNWWQRYLFIHRMH